MYVYSFPSRSGHVRAVVVQPKTRTRSRYINNSPNLQAWDGSEHLNKKAQRNSPPGGGDILRSPASRSSRKPSRSVEFFNLNHGSCILMGFL